MAQLDWVGRVRERAQPGGRVGPLRVLLVTARYLPHLGGTEIHTYEVARRLAAAGNQVTVLATDPGGRLPPAEEADGVRIQRVRSWPAERDYYFAPGLYDAITGGEWDLVHCQGYHTLVAPITMLAAWRAKIPYVVTFHSGGHSSWLRNAARPVQRMLLRPLLARAERLVGVSRFEVEFFRARLGLPAERFAVIPNGSYLPQATMPPLSDSSQPLIVSVGRLERYKGHHRVIAALPKVLAECPNARLRIVGAGPYEATLRRIAAEMGVARQVEIRAIPGADREGMARLLGGAGLVILLSDYESQGIAVMEALALGRPVLVADTSALRELAEGGLVRATSLGSTADEVAREVVAQLRQPLIPASINLPTWDRCAADLLALYHEVTGKPQWARYAF